MLYNERMHAKHVGKRECKKGHSANFYFNNNKVCVNKFVYHYKSSYSLKVYRFAYAHFICFLMNAFKYMIFVQIQIFDILYVHNYGQILPHRSNIVDNVLGFGHLTKNSSATKKEFSE